MTDELSQLVGLLRGQGIAIGVDDVARIAAVLHHTQDWSRERRVRALGTLLAKSSDERSRFDHVAALLFTPAAEPLSAEPLPGTAEPAELPRTHARVEPRRRWLVAVAGIVLVAVLALYVVRQAPNPAGPIDAATPNPALPPASGGGSPVAPAPVVEIQPTVPAPSSLPATLRGVALGFGVASLLLAAWSLLARRSDRRRRAAIAGLVRSSGRRTSGVHADCADLHPIDRRTISSLAHMLVAPAPTELETALDPGATVEQTARNAGRLTLCYERERQQPPLILVEDVSRSMERWPAHAEQLARAIEAQGQPVDRRFMAGDPMQICDRRTLDGPSARIDDLAAHGRVVIVSDGAHFDHEPARMACRARALDGTIWLAPRPGELWRSGARWVNDRAFARTLGTIPGSLTSPTGVAPVWHPPRPRADADETADAWRSALGGDAYLAFAATALLDLATSWTTTLVWALISDGVIAPPWQQFERVWDLPEMTLLSGGRISLAPELRDRLVADIRGERPELLHGVARWIDARLAAANEAAGDGSLGATVGEVYRDRVARAAGLDDSGARIRQLAERGLSSVVAAHLGDEEREAWGVRDPHASLMARLRGPLLGLALLGTAVFGTASLVAPAQLVVPVTPVMEQRTRIRSIEPNHAIPGAPVRIRGEGFTAMGRFVIVTFGKTEAMPLRISSDTEINVVIPEGIPPGPTTIELKFGSDSRSSRFSLIFIVDVRLLPPDAGDAKAGSPDDVTISGARTVDQATTIRGRRITIAAGATIRVRHGTTLAIEGNEIVVVGSAEIDGTGDDGAPGKDAPGDEYIVHDLASFERAKLRCQNNPPRGGRGSDGGRGATIVLRAWLVQDRGLIVRVEGGKAGPGGRGAPGEVIMLDMIAPPKGLPTGFKCPDREAGPPGNPGPAGSFSRMFPIGNGGQPRR